MLDMAADDSRILLVATALHALPATMAQRLTRAGLKVGAVAPNTRFLKSVPLCVRAGYSPRLFEKVLQETVAEWRPRLIVPCDDRATEWLHRWHARLRVVSDAGTRWMAELIETSLGDPRHFDVASSKSRLVALAADLGIRTPLSLPANSPDQIAVAQREIPYPAMMKSDGAFGGCGVRSVASAEDAVACLDDWRNPPSLRRAVLDSLREGRTLPFVLRRNFQSPEIDLQAIIQGSPVNRAVLCQRGRVIAGVTVKALKTKPDNGPATVVETFQHEQIKADVARLVAALGLSGFAGFDFMLDHDDRAWLIELNPRVTPAACLFSPSVSPLVSALSQSLRQADVALADPAPDQRVVMFPQEFERDPDSALLSTPEHYVPWDSPAFVKACLENTLRPNLYARASAAWRNRHPLKPAFSGALREQSDH